VAASAETEVVLAADLGSATDDPPVAAGAAALRAATAKELAQQVQQVLARDAPDASDYRNAAALRRELRDETDSVGQRRICSYASAIDSGITAIR
jgi:hypothetical protein